MHTLSKECEKWCALQVWFCNDDAAQRSTAVWRAESGDQSSLFLILWASKIKPWMNTLPRQAAGPRGTGTGSIIGYWCTGTAVLCYTGYWSMTYAYDR